MNIDRRQFALPVLALGLMSIVGPRFCRCGRGWHCEERRSLPCGAGGRQCRRVAPLCAEELSYSHSSGAVDDKAALLAGVKNAKYRWTSLEYKNPTIRVVGPAAIVRFNFVGEQEFAANGKKVPQNLAHPDELAEARSDWKLLSPAATKL